MNNEVWVITYERKELGHIRGFYMKEVKGVCDSMDYIKNKYSNFEDIVFESEDKIVIRNLTITMKEQITGERMKVHSLGGEL